MSWYTHKPYVSVAQRKAKAQREAGQRTKKGEKLDPVQVAGSKLGQTFWGKAWCDRIESFSDYQSRLPKGKSYVRNDSVIDLQIRPGRITALVMGNELYSVNIKIEPMTPAQWKAMKKKCSGQIGSIVELLQGRLSDSVMKLVTEPEDGLFPKSGQITLKCSCPDSAEMCKHLAATLYGVGARLDEKPELLFTLRQVDHEELIEEATEVGTFKAAPANRKTIATTDLSDVFGIELDATEFVPVKPKRAKRAAKPKPDEPEASAG